MRTIAVVERGNFTENIIGFLNVPDDLDLGKERDNWLKSDPTHRLHSHWEYPKDYMEFLLRIPGVNLADVEIHEV
jgi:hypothetical protein